jgi:uncharacterized protein YoxC
MTPDIKAQLENIENSNPSIHKIDKKLSILIFQVLDVLEKHNTLRNDVDCIKEKQIKDSGFIKGVAALGSLVVSALGIWIGFKK